MHRIFRITLDDALPVLAAARAKAEEIGVKQTICVVDESGQVIALHRLPGARLTGVDIAIAKAFTAAGHERATHKFNEPPNGPALPGNEAFGISHMLPGQVRDLRGRLPDRVRRPDRRRGRGLRRQRRAGQGGRRGRARGVRGARAGQPAAVTAASARRQVSSTSRQAPPGRDATPTAVRTTTPRSPSTSTSRSEAASATSECWVKPSAAFTNTTSRSARAMPSREPTSVAGGGQRVRHRDPRRRPAPRRARPPRPPGRRAAARRRPAGSSRRSARARPWRWPAT